MKKPQPLDMFTGRADDLPLFSGTPQTAKVDEFKPCEAVRQPALFDERHDMSQKVSPAEIEATLEGFTGTENYYKFQFGPLYHTHGVQYLAKATGAFWLVDAIWSHQTSAKVRREPFQVWTLTVKDNTGELVADDGNGRVIARQSIPYTDFPLSQVKLFVEAGSLDGVNPALVLLLPSEH